MKRIITLVALLIATAVTMSAQTDIKKLNKATKTTIVKLLGNTTEKWGYTDIDHYPRIGSATKDGYGPSGCELIILPNTNELLYFDTESSKYCVLSDIVPGGVKVGSKIADLQKIDFSKTKYGKNKKGNNLMLTQDISTTEKMYTIYGQEYQMIILYASFGTVTGWQFHTAENDYEMNYDKSISFF